MFVIKLPFYQHGAYLISGLGVSPNEVELAEMCWRNQCEGILIALDYYSKKPITHNKLGAAGLLGAQSVELIEKYAV